MTVDQKCYLIKTKCRDEASKQYLINEDGTYIGSNLWDSLGDLGAVDNAAIRTEAYKRYYNKCLEIKNKSNLQGNCNSPFEISDKTWGEFLQGYKNKQNGGNEYGKKYKYNTKKRINKKLKKKKTKKKSKYKKRKSKTRR